MKVITFREDGEKVRLCDLEPGALFEHDGCIALKSEYQTNRGLIEAAIVDSGEQFWGGAKTVQEQWELLVQPFTMEDAPGNDPVEVVQCNWIPVEERLPENEVDVLILAERRLYGIPETDGRKHRIVATAFHTDGKMNTEDSGYNWELWDTGAEYDEEVDAYIIPEGWWEAVRYGEEFSAVDDIVTHWMPLPEPPKEGHHEP